MLRSFVNGSKLFDNGKPYYLLITDKGNITIQKDLFVIINEEGKPSKTYSLNYNIGICIGSPNIFHINTGAIKSSGISIHMNGDNIKIINSTNNDIVFSGKLVYTQSFDDLIMTMFDITSKYNCIIEDNRDNLYFIDDITNNLCMIGYNGFPVFFEIPFTIIENGLLSEKGKNGIAIFFNINYKEEYMIIYRNGMDYVSWSLPVNMSGINAYKMLEKFIEKNI